jgi:hypothetical protein
MMDDLGKLPERLQTRAALDRREDTDMSAKVIHISRPKSEPEPESESESEYVTILEAVRQHNASLWDIGDELIKKFGAPPLSGHNDGSHAGIARCAQYLAKNGFKTYTTGYLRRLREVSSKFQGGRRRPPCSWQVHREAGSPEKLEEILTAHEAVKATMPDKEKAEKAHVTVGMVRILNQHPDRPKEGAIRLWYRTPAYARDLVEYEIEKADFDERTPPPDPGPEPTTSKTPRLRGSLPLTLKRMALELKKNAQEQRKKAQEFHDALVNARLHPDEANGLLADAIETQQINGERQQIDGESINALRKQGASAITEVTNNASSV